MSSIATLERPLSIEAQLAPRKKERQPAPQSIYDNDMKRFAEEYKRRMYESQLANFRCECADFCEVRTSRHPHGMPCKCCGTTTTKVHKKKKVELWYRLNGAGWFCFKCFYRNLMRKRNKIKPKNYKIRS